MQPSHNGIQQHGLIINLTVFLIYSEHMRHTDFIMVPMTRITIAPASFHVITMTPSVTSMNMASIPTHPPRSFSVGEAGVVSIPKSPHHPASVLHLPQTISRLARMLRSTFQAYCGSRHFGLQRLANLLATRQTKPLQKLHPVNILFLMDVDRIQLYGPSDRGAARFAI